MKMYVVEGTPDEISAVMHTMGSAPNADSASARSRRRFVETEELEDEEENETFVTTEFARAALTRIPLSKPFRAVLAGLKKAHPEMVAVSELHEISQYDPSQFAGLMGAFGRRMKHTDGYDPEALFFTSDWDEEAEAWRYGLAATVVEALDLEGIT